MQWVIISIYDQIRVAGRHKKREINPDGTYKRPGTTSGQIKPPTLVENQTAEYGPDSSPESTAQDNNDIYGLQGKALS